MASKVKGPTSPATPQATTPTGAAVGSAKTEEAPPTDQAITDAFQKAAQGLLSYKSSPLATGAYKIFSDGVVFPANILDSKDPRNDPKYLRLLAAILGLDELERYFLTLTEEQEAARNLRRKERQEEKESQSDDSDENEEEPAE